MEGFVDFAGSPEAMEQHGQFPCDGNDGSLLRVAPATSCDQQAVPAQIAVRSERTEDVLRASDQQAAKVCISFLGDASLRLALSRIVLTGNQTKQAPTLRLRL